MGENMKLPKLTYPIFEITLPFSKKQVKFRPFLVKEQKVLLVAMAQNDEEDFLLNNTKQILKNCCLSDIDIEDMAVIDLEYLLTHLRAKSVGEIIQGKYQCNYLTENGYCTNIMDVEYDITKFDIINNEYNDVIKLTDTIGIKLKYPTYKTLHKINETKEEFYYNIIKESIDYVYDEDNVYNAKDSSDEELNEFIESLSISQIKLIKNFFDNLPKIKKEISVTCKKCGHNHLIVAKGIGSFLD